MPTTTPSSRNRRPKEIRELDKKIAELQRYLLRFYQKKIKKLAATQGIPIEFFIQQYEEEIEIQVRRFVEDVYMTRIKNLEKEIMKKSPSKSAGLKDIFTSIKDLNNIRDIVQVVKDKFFNAVGRLIGRSTTSDFNPATQQLEPRTPYDDAAAMQRVAVQAGYDSFNTATESKLSEIDIPNLLLEYVTAQDERVCPICEPFDGQIFEPDDPTLPDLPQHENCRCYLEEVITSAIAS